MGLAAACTVTDTLIPAVQNMLRASELFEGFFRDLLREMEVAGAVPTPLPPLPDGPKKAVKKKWGSRKSKAPFIADSKLSGLNVTEDEKLIDSSTLSPEKKAEWEVARQNPYTLIRPFAFWIAKRCKELIGLQSNILADLEYGPHVDFKEHALDFLENRKDKEGADLVDIARQATRIPSICTAMDPE